MVHSVFVKRKGLILVYVDDIVVTGSDGDEIVRLKAPTWDLNWKSGTLEH